MDPGAEAFCLTSAICGHHIYKDIWSSIQGEELLCKRETISNVHDLYRGAVSVIIAVIKHGMSIVGHRSS